MKSFLKNLIRTNFFYKKYQDLKLFYQYKSFNPSEVKLPHSENSIYTNWREPRGRAILRSRGNGQPFIKKFWRRVIAEIQPDIIIDCGMNYGELIFSSTYKKNVKVIGIEADTNLKYFLEKSYRQHPNKDQIALCFALASDKEEEESLFYVDKEWSGRSSAIFQERFNPERVEELKVKSITLDSLFKGTDLSNQSVFFKVDVEGYEPFVLKGMKKLLNNTKLQIGCIEFNTVFFNRINYSSETFFSELGNNFHLYALDQDNHLFHIEKPKISYLQEILKTTEIKTDLLLFSDKDILKRLNLNK